MITPLLIGLSHSMETDHVVAVGNLVRIRRSFREEAILGATWGLGHTCSVMIGALSLSFVKNFIVFPEGFSFELLVGVMMVVIGIYRLFILTRRDEEKSSSGNKVLFFNVGVVHGLAGSGSIAAMLAGSVENQQEQILFLLLFGLGTIIGMGIITAAMTRLRFLQPQYLTWFSCLIAGCSFIYGIKIITEQLY
ncbi:MAG: HupE/UreJ family protein [Sporocytophaga sp.]|uniref:HupE/UreJ family protein n=1 Tax=Sporocytophaga sp. TaxID=2231183 RepID=UPI001B1CCBC9|nr:HupE/UreJ family protein [Sporocytophaga sp.]MBO9698873.1 HupE/UreJ family protein [Sporocytophaga sp.]